MTEAAVGESKGARKEPGRLARILSRKKGDDAAPKAVPAGYQPFSNKLAPGLIAVGALFSLVGAIGAWIRTSRVVAEGLPEEQVQAVMGHRADWGRLIAAVAGLTFLSAIVWLQPRVWPKLVSAALCIGTIVLIALRLPIIDEQAAGLAVQARTGEIEFISFHAGFGWGAWCLVIGAVALFLGISAGFLRELDVRRGIDA